MQWARAHGRSPRVSMPSTCLARAAAPAFLHDIRKLETRRRASQRRAQYWVTDLESAEPYAGPLDRPAPSPIEPAERFDRRRGPRTSDHRRRALAALEDAPRRGPRRPLGRIAARSGRTPDQTRASPPLTPLSSRHLRMLRCGLHHGQRLALRLLSCTHQGKPQQPQDNSKYRDRGTGA